jgi:tripartite-type tricarboxylate transporter receptor subunit TctC
MTEQGFPFPATGWQGAFAPKGTPPAILNRMHAEINRVLADPEFQKSLTKLNLPTVPIWTRDQFKAMLASDLKVWRDIVVKGNIRLEN